MSTIDSLPQEIMTEILSFLETAFHLTQCRLVCQAWNRIAEPLMLKSKITIGKAETAIKFYNYLLKDPALGKSIRHLKVEINHSDGEAFVKLMSLAFTPNIEVLGGSSESLAFFYALRDIANSSAEKFDKVKALPFVKGMSFVRYLSLLLPFKDTLQYLRLRDCDILGSTIFRDLSRFENLKSLHLDLHILTTSRLNDILKHCPNIQDLCLYVANNTVNTMLSEASAGSWNISQQVSALKTLKINGRCSTDLINYLVIKYPNLDSISIDTSTPLSIFRHDISLNARTIKKIITMIHRIPNYELRFLLCRGSTLTDLKRHINESSNSKIIDIETLEQVRSYHSPLLVSRTRRVQDRIHTVRARSKT